MCSSVKQILFFCIEGRWLGVGRAPVVGFVIIVSVGIEELEW
jgi:hypothetical protein